MKHKYYIVIKNHSYPDNKISVEISDILFDCMFLAKIELEKIVNSDLIFYKNQNIKNADSFVLDENSDHDYVIRFWDGDDYKIVVEYDIHKIKEFSSACYGEQTAGTSWERNGYEIYTNLKRNRFFIHDWLSKIKTTHSLANAIKFLEVNNI